MVSGSELTPIVTLVGAIIALLAISLIPGKNAIKKGNVKRYISWGRNAIYAEIQYTLSMDTNQLICWGGS